MRNKKLLHLTEQARKASDELTTYLTHLDARETDSSYQHARMLFDEGWRLRFMVVFSMQPAVVGAVPPEDVNLWMEAAEPEEGDVSPVHIVSPKRDDDEILKALQLTTVPSTAEVLKFLAELTEEIGVYPPRKAS